MAPSNETLRLSVRGALTLSGLVGFGAVALGQDGSIPTDSQGTRLEVIVVTAQKREESLQKVPVSVSAISGASLEQANITQTSELPQIAPTLTFTQGFFPNATTFNIRGLGTYVTRIGVQQAVSTVVDGVPMARAGDFVAELGDIERVEVLSGPQGTLFGRNTVGGVINIIRKKPDPWLEASFDVNTNYGRLGDNDTLTKAMVNIPVTDKIKSRIFAFWEGNDPYIKNLTGKDIGRNNNWGLLGKLSIDFADNVNLLISADGGKAAIHTGEPDVIIPLQASQQPFIPNVAAKQTALFQGAIGDPFATALAAPYQTYQDLWNSIVDFTWNVARGWRVKSLSSFRYDRFNVLNYLYPTPATPQNPMGWDLLNGSSTQINPYPGTSRVTDWRFFTNEERLEYTGGAFDVIGGFYYSKLKEAEFVEQPRFISAEARGPSFVAAIGTPANPAAAFPYYYTNQPTNSFDANTVEALFADITYHVTDALRAFVGARFSRESLDYTYAFYSWSNLPVKFGTNFDPITYTPTVAPTQLNLAGNHDETDWAGRVGAAWDASPTATVYATVNRGYIGSGVDLSTGTAGKAKAPSTIFLLPTTSVNYEVGIKSEFFDHRLRVNAALFDQKTKNTQLSAFNPANGLVTVSNAGDVDAYGAELNLNALVMEKFMLSSGISLIHSEIKGLFLSCYPGQTAAAGCNIPAGARFVQSIDGKPAVNTPSAKFNFAGTYTIGLVRVPFDLELQAQYSWQDKVFYQIDHDPYATQPAYGILNLGASFVDRANRYRIRLYAENATDQFYCPNEIVGATARQACQSTPNTAEARFGIDARVNFK